MPKLYAIETDEGFLQMGGVPWLYSKKKDARFIVRQRQKFHRDSECWITEVTLFKISQCTNTRT